MSSPARTALRGAVGLATALVAVTACTSDKRGVWAELTESGLALLEQAAPYHVEGVRENLVDLATSEDFAAVGRVFDAVSEHIGQR